ncbi:MAG: type I-F CRISPR-associated protein Csy1 [Desulfobulbus sp.]|jgi:CRISPR-associated protein Csy1|uniref:type I-F CRISPR-associated protein Csy1 n=1 Tax=Desulfobulbus sp. TaxID=895 RepID=UPI0028411648|nr:type I-F CRISPR-associated protein Csy1 [Desulfobulbus sp.]MDR2549039.1 type I-F CRISPR-associated protein Csy1 [Desulfobulbus sp.]
MVHPNADDIDGLHKVMVDFLTTRRDAKIEKLKPDDPKRDELREQYELQAWLADAARRVGQIQAATHTLKAIHPDARGTNLYCRPTTSPDSGLVGSSLLKEYATDVIGNAAALDVNKFLTQEYQGKTLLAWMQQDEDVVIAAFQTDDPDTARQWVQAFLGVVHGPGQKASHTLAKQVYWLVGDDPCENEQFHLLAPLYPSSLVHHVYLTIQEHRYGEATKAAREARRNNALSEHILHEYPGLAIQQLGGTKPQNIGHLNQERKGVNYLLASCPPVWRAQELKPPFGPKSIFSRFGRNEEVQKFVGKLRKFLESNPSPNQSTRDRRDDLLFCIINELRQFTAQYRLLSPGWSADARCRLAESEQCWLDPQRAALDADFAETWQRMAWKDEIERRFGNWLNAQLGRTLPLDDIAHAYWVDFFDDEEWRRQIKSDQRKLEKEAENG